MGSGEKVIADGDKSENFHSLHHSTVNFSQVANNPLTSA